MGNNESFQNGFRRFASNGCTDIFSNTLLCSLYYTSLTYLTTQKLQVALAEMGCSSYTIYSKNGTQAFMAEFANYAVVGFRGNVLSRWKEIKSDLFCWKREYYGIRVHSGFAYVLDYVSNKIIDDVASIDPAKPLLYTGHSLGGALALLFSIRHKPTHIYTFGAPCISGKQELDSILENTEVVRVTVASDRIPGLPPKMFGYEHCGIHLQLPSESGVYFSHKLSTYIDKIMPCMVGNVSQHSDF